MQTCAITEDTWSSQDLLMNFAPTLQQYSWNFYRYISQWSIPFLRPDQMPHWVDDWHVLLHHNMCSNTRIAFTGPYSKLEKCPICSKSWCHPGTCEPAQQFTTIPLSPILQCFYSPCKTAEKMHYLEKRLTSLMEYAWAHNRDMSTWDDTACLKRSCLMHCRAIT